MSAAIVSITPVDPVHAAGLFTYMADPAISTFLAWSPHRSCEETRAVLKALASAHSDGRAAHWTVFCDNDAAGLISLIDLRRRHREWRIDRGELAYWVGGPFQGRGVARRACALVLSEAFDVMALNKIVIGCARDNHRSVQLAKRLGAHCFGEERRAFEKDGQWRDLLWFEIMCEDDAWRDIFTSNGET